MCNDMFNVVKGLLYGRDVPFDQIDPGIPHQPSGRYGIPGPILSKVTPFPYNILYVLGVVKLIVWFRFPDLP